MTDAVIDTIERTLEVKVPIERVWRALTDPAEVSQWFGDFAEIDLAPGGAARFGWAEDVFRARIATVEPPHRFVYHWVNGLKDDPSVPFDQMPTTRVDFLLEETAEGTRIHLVESGFSLLAQERKRDAIDENTEGWSAELADLQAYLEERG